MTNRMLPRSSGAGTKANPIHVVVDPTPMQLAQFSADVSLVTAAAQYVPPGGRVATSLTALAGFMQAISGTITGLDVAFIGNVLNIAGQTITVKIQRSTDHGATFADVPGATSGPIATTAGAQSASVTMTTPITKGEGDILQAILTPSALLTAVVTNVAVGVKGT